MPVTTFYEWMTPAGVIKLYLSGAEMMALATLASLVAMNGFMVKR